MGDFFDSLESGCATLFGIAWLIMLGIYVPCMFIAHNSYIGLMWWSAIASIILSWIAYFITKDVDTKKNHPSRWTFTTIVWVGFIVGMLYICQLYVASQSEKQNMNEHKKSLIDKHSIGRTCD